MMRKIIKIDQSKCNGCGACVGACHEGAIGIVDGKAQLVKVDYCDGLGDCLPVCPTDAISFAENDAVIHMGVSQGVSQLRQWPIQIKLVPLRAHWMDDAKLLIAADCTAYAYANFHDDFIQGHITLVGCPKLDAVDYAIKLTEILSNNTIRSITVVRMEVPCCGGIEFAVKKALLKSGKDIPMNVITISTDGNIV